MRMPGRKLVGKIATGLGKASDFTEVPWAKSAFRKILGEDPYPGTVNIILSKVEYLEIWEHVRTSRGIVVSPPQPDWCDAFCYKAKISGKIDAAVVLPDVAEYPQDQVELIAPVNVREALSLADGDNVEIEILDVECE